MKKQPPSFLVAGVRFSLVRSGLWHSEDGRFACYRMLEGTSQQQWEAYRQAEGLDGAALAYNPTLGGLFRILATEFYGKKAMQA